MVQRGKKLLSLLLTAAMVASLVVVPAFATDTPDTTGTTGEAQDADKNNEGGGSEGTPQGAGRKVGEASENPFQVGEKSYATLQEAFDAISENETGTIIVTNDVTVNETARCTGTRKNITIKSGENGPFTITRGEIESVQDVARSTYNPAMIEIDGTLRLENIILDDNCVTAGGNYIQATTTEDGKIPSKWDKDGNPTDYYSWSNATTVQDAIIATYDGGDEIVLGNGVELRNFGGMSAVRLSGGKLTMEAGSKIVGSKEFTTKGETGSYGAAGAVWIQGGEFIMNEGAFIGGVENMPMHGRAVYVDSGSATINGTISNITKNGNMWQGAEGVGIHVRNSAQVTLGSTGVIDGNNQIATGVITNNTGSVFTMDAGSCIKNFVGDAISVQAGSTLNMNGEITGLTTKMIGRNTFSGKAINLQGGGDSVCTIGATGNIHHNHVGRTTIYLQTGTLHLYGKIHHNYSDDKSGGVEVNNNSWGEFTMYPGAEITDNYATEHGAGVMVCKGIFTMEGGTIARNVAGNQGGGVCVRRGGQFLMKDGEIKDNVSAKEGGGVAHDAYETNYGKMPVVLQGGTISGNKMNAIITLDQEKKVEAVSVSGGTGNDLAVYYEIDERTKKDLIGFGSAETYISIEPAMNVDRNVYTKVDQKDVNVTDGTKLGNAAASSINGLTTEAATRGFAAPIATFWAQNSNGVAATVSGVTLTEKPVYVLTQATDEKGAPVTNAEFTLLPATVKDGSVSFNLSDTGETGCAVALVQPDNANGTLTITTDVAELTEGQESYEISYNLSFEPTQAAAATEGVTVTINSPLLSGNKTVLLSKGANGIWTGTWVGTLSKDNFKVGETIITGAVATITAGVAGTKPVYADGVSILMKALNTYTVTFNSNGGSAVPSQTVKDGSTATQPTAPTYSGYTFNGWRIEGATTNYDFDTPVTSDLTLVAQWTQNSGGGGTGGGGGGGGGGGIDIPDDPTPLGGDLQLNREDHFAYVSGYPDSSVQPGGHITREEVATIFYRLLTEQSKAIYGVTTNNFNDVEAERWSNEAISTLANAQVLQGYADGGFHPGDPITRAEFTAIVTRFDEVDSAPASPFSDTAGHWAEDVIAFAASKNWVGGYPDGSFRPQSDITRAEAMTMINNILDRLVDEEGILAEARQWPDNAKDAWYYYAVQEATNAHDYTRRSADGIVENWTALR